MNLQIPPRQAPKKAWALTEREMDALDYSIMFAKPRWEVYNVFCAPALSEAQCKTKASALWSSRDAREYLEIRKTDLLSFFHPDKDDGDSDDDAITQGDIRKVKKLVVSKALDGTSSEQWDAVKLVAPHAFKEEDTGVEAPRRYLPVMCRASPCRYLAYCELNLADGCEYCKYKKYANDHGIEYDYKNMLSIPFDDPIRELFEPLLVEGGEEPAEQKKPSKKKVLREVEVEAAPQIVLPDIEPVAASQEPEQATTAKPKPATSTKPATTKQKLPSGLKKIK